MKKFLLGIAACSMTLATLAQDHHFCATDQIRQRLIETDPTYLAREAEYAEELRQLIGSNVEYRDDDVLITIPIVFHVLHLGGRENISDEQIWDEVEILNRDFANLNPALASAVPHFQNISADTKIQFKLPTRDPLGNCTNGIDRIQTVETFRGRDASKLRPWPRSKYLNIWVTDVIDRPGILGYAYTPGSAEGANQISDGIMVLHSAIGSIGTANASWGGTLTHEIGHSLSLLHLWGQTNQPGVECGDDLVQDTPWTEGYDNCENVYSYTCSETDLGLVTDFSWFPDNNGTSDPTPHPDGSTGVSGIQAVFPFADVNFGSGPVDITPQPGIFVPGISGSAVEHYPFTAVGVTPDPKVEGEFAFSGWSTDGSIDLNRYYEYTFIPQQHFGVNIDTMRFSIRRSQTGPRAFAVRATSDLATNLPLTVGVGSIEVGADNVATMEEGTTAFTHNVTVLLGDASPDQSVTIRIYAWNALDAEGYFSMDNFRLLGDVWHSGLEYQPFNAVGVSPGSAVGQEFAFTNWGTGAPDGATEVSQLEGAVDLGKYYEFTITPHIQYAMQAQQLVMRVRRSADGPRSFSVRRNNPSFQSNMQLVLTPGAGVGSAVDNTAFFTEDVAGDWATITVNLGPGNPNQQPLSIRIYAWNAETTEGFFSVDDVQLTGTFGIIENVENYMEYAFCQKMFTKDQKARMRAALHSDVAQRRNLWTDANLQSTGVAEGFEAQCAPIADFYAVPGSASGNFSNPVVPYPPLTCTGTDILFKNNSGGGVATSWEWTFQDGEPATSTERDPVVTFTSPGWKSVTLTASNAVGSHTKTSPTVVYISDASDAMQGLSSYGFEQDLQTWPFIYENYENNITRWQRLEGVGHTGNACIYLNAGDRDFYDVVDMPNSGDIDDLISPNLDLTGVQDANLSFWYSYSTRTTYLDSAIERLELQRSTDCGRTWTWLTGGANQSTIEASSSTNGLITNGNSTVPGGWTFRTYTLPPAALTSNVRFRFRFISSEYSNNLYLDDINIGGPVGITNATGNTPMTVYPNPTNDHFFVEMAGMDVHPTEITLMDGRGAIVHTAIHTPQGGNGIMISSRELNLAEGIYVLRVSNLEGTSTQMLMVGR